MRLFMWALMGLMTPGLVHAAPARRIAVLSVDASGSAFPADTIAKMAETAPRVLRQNLITDEVLAPQQIRDALGEQGERELKALLRDSNALVDEGITGNLHATHVLLQELREDSPTVMWRVRLVALGTGADVAHSDMVVATRSDDDTLKTQQRALGALLVAAGWINAPPPQQATELAANAPPTERAATAAPPRAATTSFVLPAAGGSLAAVGAVMVAASAFFVALSGVGVAGLYVAGVARLLPTQLLPRGVRFPARVASPVALGFLGVTACAGGLLLLLGGGATVAWWQFGDSRPA